MPIQRGVDPSPPPSSTAVLRPGGADQLLDGAAGGTPSVEVPEAGLSTIGVATIINPGVEARIESVELLNAVKVHLRHGGVHLLKYDGTTMPIAAIGWPPADIVVTPLQTEVPISLVGENGSLLASVQLLLGVDFEEDGSFDGVRVVWLSGDGARHTLDLRARANN